MLFQPNSSVLAIFCRRPSLGVGKQRLAVDIGSAKALQAAELLLETTLEDARAWPHELVISPAAQADVAWAETLADGAQVIAQPAADNLGARLQYVDEQIRAAGGRRIIFIGSDSPTLSPQLLDEAAANLREVDVVLIPAMDGGVTLMGSRVPWPDLSTLPWETDTLGSALQDACRGAGMSVRIIGNGYDIDELADLLRLPELLAHDDRPARRDLCAWIDRQNLSGQSLGGNDQRISVVIPVYRDYRELETLLQRLEQMQADIDDIVVVDGDAQHECELICEKFGATYITSAPNRGAQLRAGADAAKGEILWFLHADSEPRSDAAIQIRQHVGAGNEAGYFRFRFAGKRTWYKSLLEQLINLRTRVGIPYGDQGLFVLRSAYEKANGHAATPLFEEVSLIKTLRRDNRCAPLTAPLPVSPRRWEQDGWLTRSLHNRWLALAFAAGVAPEKLAHQYRRKSPPQHGTPDS